MLAHRLRRRANIESTMCQRLVFAGMSDQRRPRWTSITTTLYFSENVWRVHIPGGKFDSVVWLAVDTTNLPGDFYALTITH